MKQAFAVFALLAPAGLYAQGLAIDHRPVGCIVAEQHPRLNACVAPQSSLARARIYFRAGGGPHWYFVEMKNDVPCLIAVLPKPKKTIRKIDYYVESVDKAFAESRTAEFSPDVVPEPGECRKDVLAPFIGKATVVVGAAAGAPAVPFGFASAGIVGAAGGVSAGVVAAGVVGAGAATAGAVALAGKDEGGASTTTAPAAPTTTAPAATTTTTTTTTSTTLAGQNSAPDADFRVNPDPPVGDFPFLVAFNMCRSSDPDGDELIFKYDFGDGATFRGVCRAEHTYSLPGFVGSSAAAPLAASFPPAPPREYTATLCVTDGKPRHEECKSYRVRAEFACGNDRQDPDISFPGPARTTGGGAITLSADASDDNAVSEVIFYARPVGSNLFAKIGSDGTGSPYTVQWCPASGSYELKATAVDVCGKSKDAFPPSPVSISGTLSCFGAAADAASAVRVVSELAVAGGSGQAVLNGASLLFAGRGRAAATAAAPPGLNRVDAQLVTGDGRAGTWRFELGGRVVAGSLRVIAGPVVEVAGESVTFHMSGAAGERVVFTFRTR